MPINIAITDDDNLVVQLLESYLNSQDGLKVLFTAGCGKELFEKLLIQIPDVLLLDLKMEQMDGVEVTRQLRNQYPSIKIIVISSHYQRSFMGFMLKTGTSAFLPKGISPSLLIDIINIVHEKGIYFMDDQLDVIREQISSRSPKPAADNNLLSEREKEILRLIAQQKTAKEIGDILFIAPRTVEGHKNNLFAKTGTKNTAGLVIYALQQNIIQIEDLPLL